MSIFSSKFDGQSRPRPFNQKRSKTKVYAAEGKYSGTNNTSPFPFRFIPHQKSTQRKVVQFQGQDCYMSKILAQSTFSLISVTSGSFFNHCVRQPKIKIKTTPLEKSCIVSSVCLTWFICNKSCSRVQCVQKKNHRLKYTNMPLRVPFHSFTFYKKRCS